MPKWLIIFLLPFSIQLLSLANIDGIHFPNRDFKVELLDSDETEFFISHTMDLKGNLFVGCREALFMYKSNQTGTFKTRKELYRFPKDAWLYDLEVYGNQLFVLTNTALYKFENIYDSKNNLKPIKLLWGLPQGHIHQGLHAIEFSPSGTLLIAMGDPHPRVYLDTTRPDHFWHWTFYIGQENKPFRYNGVGAILELNLQNQNLSVFSHGLRNACGLNFDPNWNLYTNDNDQEGSKAAPGKLIYAPKHSLHNWPRGWSAEQETNRNDLIPSLDLTLDVPVGQGWFQDSVLVANWGSKTISRHYINSSNEGLSSKTSILLQAEGSRRPVSIMETNEGRLIASICYMEGNEGSPVRKTDLLLITPIDYQARSKNTTDLFNLLEESWPLRHKAHTEILRIGGTLLDLAASKFLNCDPRSPAFSSLIYLAVASKHKNAINEIIKLSKSKGPAKALAMNVIADHPDMFNISTQDFNMTNNNTFHEITAYLNLCYSQKTPFQNSWLELCQHKKLTIQQIAQKLCSQSLSYSEIIKMSKNNHLPLKLAIQLLDQKILSELQNLDQITTKHGLPNDKHLSYVHPEGKIELKNLENPIALFNSSDWWQQNKHSDTYLETFKLLFHALNDPVSQKNAASLLYFLNDDRTTEKVQQILEQHNVNLALQDPNQRDHKREKRALAAIKDAKVSETDRIPTQFKHVDWRREINQGHHKKGRELFTTKGCIACHKAPHNGIGGSLGPSLKGIHTRFTPNYLAESILLPNRFVSPNFHPTKIRLKNDITHMGFIESEGKTIKLRLINGSTIDIDKSDIVSQEMSSQSMMPAGLVTKVSEMRDLLKYLLAKK